MYYLFIYLSVFNSLLSYNKKKYSPLIWSVQLFFSIPIELYSHQHALVLEHFCHAEIPYSSFPGNLHFHTQPSVRTNLLFVSTSVPFLDISYQWNYITCSIMFLRFIHVVACTSSSVLSVTE